MTGVELKLYLKENPYLICNVLDSIGCTNINIKNDKITCCNPDGDNSSAVNVMLNDTLNCTNYTRPDYKVKYNIRDIITLIQFFLGDISLNDSIKYIEEICNIKDNNISKRSDTVRKLKKLKQNITKDFSCNDKVLNENELNQYMNVYINHKFLNEGITEEIQDEFQIRYDLISNRAIIPIRNDKGELITFKGRSLFDDEYRKEHGINKYIYSHKFSGKYYLYGEYENREFIKNANEIIVFEAEKSVQQSASFGIRNCVAISKHDFSTQQIRKLISYNKPIVIMFDKDVGLKDILNQCAKFKGVDVYYVYDTDGYLSKKMSPTDEGLYTFEMLYDNCKYKYDPKEGF